MLRTAVLTAAAVARLHHCNSSDSCAAACMQASGCRAQTWVCTHFWGLSEQLQAPCATKKDKQALPEWKLQAALPWLIDKIVLVVQQIVHVLQA